MQSRLYLKNQFWTVFRSALYFQLECIEQQQLLSLQCFADRYDISQNVHGNERATTVLRTTLNERISKHKHIIILTMKATVLIQVIFVLKVMTLIFMTVMTLMHMRMIMRVMNYVEKMT